MLHSKTFMRLIELIQSPLTSVNNKIALIEVTSDHFKKFIVYKIEYSA